MKILTDKFPEAFRRFESSHDIKDLTFSEIVRKFAEWQQYHTTGTQEHCIASEVSHLPQIKFYKQQIFYKTRNITRSVFRNKKTGRFYKPV